jgi:hypothetical protein
VVKNVLVGVRNGRQAAVISTGEIDRSLNAKFGDSPATAKRPPRDWLSTDNQRQGKHRKSMQRNQFGRDR